MALKQEKSVDPLTLTKSELINYMIHESPHLLHQDVELAVNSILDCMTKALVNGERIEIRGFGSLSLHYRSPKIGRNPKSGDEVKVPEKYAPHFKPGAALRLRVDQAQ